MKRFRALLSVVLACTVMPLLTVSTAEAGRGLRPLARHDTVSVTAGRATVLRVKANDRAYRKRKARISLAQGRHARVGQLRATVRRGRSIRFVAPPSATARTYTLWYRLVDVRGRRDTARITVRVRPGPDELRKALDALPVAPEDRSGFDRSRFEHWIDADGDGCDTRQEVLLAEAVAPRIDARCIFKAGSWHSWYDNANTTDPTSLHIDHVVPLAEAWDSGASDWDATTRTAYANDLGDPRTLVAVTASANRAKRDRDPAQWLPARRKCRYVAHWVAVKTRWSLSIDADEKAALERAIVASNCGTSAVDVARAAVNVEPSPDPETPTDPSEPHGPSDLPLLDVVAAQDLAGRVGIRDFPHYDHTTYGKRGAVETALGDLGVHWVSLKYVPARDEIADLERLHAMGIRTILTVGETKGGYAPESAAFWNGLTENLVRWGPKVPMVVGWNEPNHIRGGVEPLPSDWPLRTLRDNIVPLRKAVVAANARMSHSVDVGLPALWSGDTTQFLRDAEKLASVRFTDASGRTWSTHNAVDALTFHLYPRGGDPTWQLDQTIDALRTTFPAADPTPWCTEAGYFTASNYTGGARPVTEAQAAVYTAKMGLEYHLRGGYVSYFETLDDPDPGDSDREANLGLIDTPSMDPASWRRKPAFASLAQILQRKGGSATRVRAAVRAPAGVQRLATVDGKGDVVLYLWRRVDVNANGYAAPVEVTVTTPTATRTVQVGGSIVAVPLDG